MSLTGKAPVAVAAIFLVGAGLWAARLQEKSFTLTLSPSELHVTSGGEISPRVEFRNTSGSGEPFGNMDFDGQHAEDNYPPLDDIIVLNAGGKRAPVTASGRRWEHSVLVGEGGVMPTVRPSGSITETLVLSRLFDLTIPGVYTVWVSKGGVESNRVVVTVAG
ncbi:MAG: hypothetical protein ACRD01_13985 [Terriglobales bacterium]